MACSPRIDQPCTKQPVTSAIQSSAGRQGSATCGCSQVVGHPVCARAARRKDSGFSPEVKDTLKGSSIRVWHNQCAYIRTRRLH